MGDGTSHHIVGESSAFPEKVAVGQIVAADPVGGGDHHLHGVGVREDMGGRPGGGFVAVPAPALVAGSRVEGHDEGRALVIPVHHQGVAVERGRGPFTVSMLGVHVAQVLFPEHISLQVEGEQPVGSEEGIDALAVGDGGRGGITARVVAALVRKAVADSLLPDGPARVAVKGGHHESCLTHLEDIVVGPGAQARGRVDRFAMRDGGGEIDAVLPHDGRGMSRAGDGDFPPDVVVFAPLSRRGCPGGHPGIQRSAPLSPVALIARSLAGQGGRKEDGEDPEQAHG